MFAFPGHLLNKAMLQGLIWYVMPMFIITINDIMAYMVGFFIGRTPLIKLSPKKGKIAFMLSTMLKNQNFSVMQILREINFGQCRSSKTAVFAIFWGSKYYQVGQIEPSKNAKKS